MGFIHVWEHQTTFSTQILGINLECKDAQKQVFFSAVFTHLNGTDEHKGTIAK